MLCNRCKKREAKIYYTEIVKGQKKEECLCEECAMGSTSLQGAIPSLGGFLSNILSNYFGEQMEQEQKEIKEVCCSVCGMTSSKLMEMKKLGCANCCNVFKESLEKAVPQIQLATKHKGKRPNTFLLEVEETLNSISNIERLEILLQEAVEKEDFEEAVRLRDEIRALKKQEQQNDKSNINQSQIEEIYEKEF